MASLLKPPFEPIFISQLPEIFWCYKNITLLAFSFFFQHHVKHRLLELLLSPEGGERYLPSYADHVLATPKMDYARIQREHFPLETPTSLRGCFHACLRMSREPTQEEYKEEAENAKCFLDRLRLAWVILESSSRATKREGNKVAEGVIGAYERARGRAEQELKKKSKAKDRMVH